MGLFVESKCEKDFFPWQSLELKSWSQDISLLLIENDSYTVHTQLTIIKHLDCLFFFDMKIETLLRPNDDDAILKFFKG